MTAHVKGVGTAGALTVVPPSCLANVATQVPNPLFDLAGAFSGYLLVPFWTFFLATVVGKAVNKVTLQVRSDCSAVWASTPRAHWHFLELRRIRRHSRCLLWPCLRAAPSRSWPAW